MEGFRVNTTVRRQLAEGKRQIDKRLDKTKLGMPCPVLSASNIHYEISSRQRAISTGGIGAIHQMVKWLGLDSSINESISVLKLRMPYAESDHILNIAYNLLAGGTCLEHLELRRLDIGYLNTLGGRRIPDPTTAGDFCCRFTGWHALGLMEVTDDWTAPAEEIVRQANQRCNQENLIQQQKKGVCALTAPLDDLVSNWVYMIIASLAWSLKAWVALLLPVHGRWRDEHEKARERRLRMDFSTFRNAFMQIPAQIINTGRRLIFRLLSWNPWESVLFRFLDTLRRPLRC
jgi:hypothetical protein